MVSASVISGGGGLDLFNCAEKLVRLVSAPYISVISSCSFGDPTVVRGIYDNAMLRTIQNVWHAKVLPKGFTLSLSG